MAARSSGDRIVSDDTTPLDDRLAALTLEKRRLLERRLAAAGLHLSAAADTAGAAPSPLPESPAEVPAGEVRMTFSVFFFSADGSTDSSSKYEPLLQTARYADRHGFAAVWVPERHFQPFGGLYPNPSLLGVALAMVTERLQIRAGSVVLPLHHPVRVAEEWSVVDNFSGGRAAISCASGWHPDDFVLRPETFEERRDVLFRDLETIRRLWAGETVRMSGAGGGEAEVAIMPRPIQRRLPVWITSGGSRDTWERAGEAGANILATLGSQPLPDLEAKISGYRQARRRAGHDPAAGVVSLMLHTFVGDDQAAVEERVREPLSDYLRLYLRQRDNYLELPGITDADREALIPLAFEHYLRSASLVGTPDACRRTVARLAAVGVDEIACLVDFGLELDEILASLEKVAVLARELAPRPAAGEAR